MRSWIQFILQDSASLRINILIKFHDFILIIMISVLRIISYSILFLIINKYSNDTLKGAQNRAYLNNYPKSSSSINSSTLTPFTVLYRWTRQTKSIN